MDIQKIDLFLDEYQLEESARKIVTYIRPEWKLENLKFKVFTDGITNKLIGCWNNDDSSDAILVRIYGKNTDLLIDREEEKSNFFLLHKSGYAPKLYATFQNGLAYAYLPGETINTTTVRDISIYPLIAITMARIHSIRIGQENPPIIWNKIKKFLNLVPNEYTSTETQQTYKQHFPEGVNTLNNELDLLRNILLNEGGDVVFCHNDLLLSNIIHNDGTVSFIDYEYSGWNYQAFDIGNHFAEFAGVADVDYTLYPERDLQYHWLKLYLEEYFRINSNDKRVTGIEINKFYLQVNKFALVSHLFWASWAMVQAQNSTINFNFMGYAVVRLEEYFKRKDSFLK